MRKVLLIGLDCAAPDLVFRRFKDKLPNLKNLMEKGKYGNLTSCDPPITIPAWMVMVTGRTPGELGVYGFRHRKGNSYNEQWIATSNRFKEKKIWDILAGKNGESCLVGVPPSYPVFPVEGNLVGCFITPTIKSRYTYPEELADEIEELVGEYLIDVEFRLENKKGILEKIYEMTEKRFKVIRHLMIHRNWRFFMFVIIGLDRIHHAFWRYFDTEHHLYEPGNEFEKVVEDYYIYLDRKIGELLEITDDQTIVLVSSDHGGKAMKGCFCINTWLEEKGLLKIKEGYKGVKRLSDVEVDWRNTTAWGWGGYYARVFLNVKGREEKGIIEPEKYENVRNKIKDMIKEIKGPNGEIWDTMVLKPEEIFPEIKGNPPDLMVYFDNLSWRSAGTIGHLNKYLLENDTGPDDAVHDKKGLYIYYDPKNNLHGEKEDKDILDVAPTLMKILDLEIPKECGGAPIVL